MTALSGDLSVFPPADVLQFLGYTRSAGALELSNGGAAARVYLEEGRISAVEADVDRPRLGDLLRATGRVTGAAVESAALRALAAGRPLGEVLVESGEVAPDTLAEVLQDQLLAVLSRLLAWEHGTFQFRPGVAARGPRYPDRPPLDRLLFESLRRLDEETESLGRVRP
ncbi:MAG: DUF4388 domain-containing protein [Candidatus Eisenbacteria bacterium]|nr:DUF4388 domain-containing protein [Candidatus Eisenbacteria bacterium]